MALYTADAHIQAFDEEKSGKNILYLNSNEIIYVYNNDLIKWNFKLNSIGCKWYSLYRGNIER